MAWVINKAFPSDGIDMPFKHYNRVVPTNPLGTLAPLYAGERVVALDVGSQYMALGLTAETWVDGEAAMVPIGPTAPDDSLLLTFAPGTDRNDFSGEVGVRLGIGAAPVSFTWMGARRGSVTQTGMHTIKLYEWFADSLIVAASVDFDSVAVGEYAWVAVPETVLAAGGYYFLAFTVIASDGQMWCNPGAITLKPSITNIYDCYRLGAGSMQTGLANSMFIGLDLGWNV